MNPARTTTGRVGALDIGDVRTGVAISDETRTIARPLDILGRENLLQNLQKIFRDEGVSKVIVGVPKTLSGEVGHQARRVLDTLTKMRSMMPDVEFIEWDERFTTRMSREVVRGRGGKKRRSERLDHLAAARMLQEYLESGGALETLR